MTKKFIILAFTLCSFFAMDSTAWTLNKSNVDWDDQTVTIAQVGGHT